eukprot:2183591-Pyramimonas_sp.AAC.1
MAGILSMLSPALDVDTRSSPEQVRLPVSGVCPYVDSTLFLSRAQLWVRFMLLHDSVVQNI